MALLTNNVREWEPLWRSMLPVDEIFELVVDSAFVGMRKPDARDLRADARAARRRGRRRAECLFVDDVEVNVDAARELGMQRRPLPRQRAGDRRDRVAPSRLTAVGYGRRVKRDAAVEAVFKPVRPPTTFEETVERLGTAIRHRAARAGHQAPARARARRRAADLALDPAPGADDAGPERPPDVARGRSGGTFVAERPPLLGDAAASRSATTPGTCSTTGSRSRPGP